VIRDEPVVDRLYKLAAERKVTHAQKVKEAENKPAEKLISDRSEKFLSSKFLKEFNSVYAEVDFEGADSLNYYRLN